MKTLTEKQNFVTSVKIAELVQALKTARHFSGHTEFSSPLWLVNGCVQASDGVVGVQIKLFDTETSQEEVGFSKEVVAELISHNIHSISTASIFKSKTHTSIIVDDGDELEWDNIYRRPRVEMMFPAEFDIIHTAIIPASKLLKLLTGITNVVVTAGTEGNKQILSFAEHNSKEVYRNPLSICWPASYLRRIAKHSKGDVSIGFMDRERRPVALPITNNHGCKFILAQRYLVF